MNHVSDAGNQPKDAVRNFLVKPNGLAVLYDAILRACHDHDWHRQFFIAMPHGQGDRDHRDAVLTSLREFALVVRTCRGEIFS